MSTSPAQNPAEIAREAFRRLALKRIAPTPEAYRDIYNDIAGITEAKQPQQADAGAELILGQVTARLSETPGDIGEAGRRLQRTLKARDWEGFMRGMSQLLDKQLKKPGPFELAVLADEPEARLLRDLLSRTLIFAVASLLAGSPALVSEAESLGNAVKAANNEAALNEVAARLKQLCYQIEIRSGDVAEQQELLLRLFRLLLDNVSELLDNDSWLRGQVDAVQELIAGPIDQRALEDAMRSL
ncbi:MAG: GGDEF domain-containing protein, partial [Telluria sp.]